MPWRTQDESIRSFWGQEYHYSVQNRKKNDRQSSVFLAAYTPPVGFMVVGYPAEAGEIGYWVLGIGYWLIETGKLKLDNVFYRPLRSRRRVRRESICFLFC